ncbi:MAG TPA: PepSY-associated TM helix domain-containing protein [Flavobacterium sp.]|jgi:uncharacterized iron-regulated membrane protein
MRSKSKFKKAVRQIHLWLGFTSGLIVFIVSITGCIYVFETELRSLYEHQFTNITPQQGPILLPEALKEIGRKALEEDLGKTIDPKYEYISYYKDPGKTAHYYVFSEEQSLYHYVYINQYTGEVLKIKDINNDFFAFVIKIHYSLLLPDEIGETIIGVAVIIFVLMLITGIILWFPKNKTSLKQRFTIRWNAKWRRVNYDAHNVFGFYHFLLALIIALTGLTWSFDWMQETVDWIANGGAYSAPAKEFTSSAPLIKGKFDPVFKDHYNKKDFEILAIYFPKSPETPISITKNKSATTFYDSETLYYDQSSAQLLHTETYAGSTPGQKMRALNFDIHIGKVLGLPGQILAFIASLISASLPVTGFLIWYGRKFKKKKKK